MFDQNQTKATLEKVLQHALSDIEQETNISELHRLKSVYLGKKSYINRTLQNLHQLNNEDKAVFGQLLNQTKITILTNINQKITQVEQINAEKNLSESKIDFTLPSVDFSKGVTNPLFLVINELKNIFSDLGYEIISGPEVDSEEYNFDKLNLGKNHPARTMQDTFYLKDQTDLSNRYLLRTHCTNVTARMLTNLHDNRELPLAFISIGNVYRKDDDDATHSHQFNQIDVFLIGQNITFANLKWTLEYLAQKLFGSKTEIRLRPSYFPFTEPSAEVDVSCPLCQKKGCAVCKQSGWIEILGSGMIHPDVFVACGHDPKQISGFAFGIGIERIAMIKYQIDDIRLFYNNDLRFLKQF